MSGKFVHPCRLQFNPSSVNDSVMLLQAFIKFKATCSICRTQVEVWPHKATGLPTLKDLNKVFWLLRYCKLPNNSCIVSRIQSSQGGSEPNSLVSCFDYSEGALHELTERNVATSQHYKNVTKFPNKLTTSMRDFSLQPFWKRDLRNSWILRSVDW
jgi:hypothetical protein